MLTIGQRLKQERESRYLTIEKAADETRIRAVFLRALEADDYSALPSAAQGRGFLRNYAEYLNINIDEIIAEMQRNAPPPQEVHGPLSQVNLVETEVPSLTESDRNEKTPPFWTSWFAPKKGTESTPEEIPAEPVHEKVEEIKVAAQEMPVETEQTPAEDAAEPSLLARLLALIPSRKAEVEVESNPVVEEKVETPKPSAPSKSANEIFVEIGKKLRERRELISLTVDEVERHTKVRAVFIKALEEGAFEKLPSPVQTRGMLANYAAFLDMDTDAILLRFADSLQARRREKYSETPREKIQTEVKASIPLWRDFIAGDLVFGIIMIAIILVLGIWGIGLVIDSQNEVAVDATAPSIVDVLADVPLETPLAETFVPVEENPLATNAPGVEAIATPTLNVNANVTVSIFAVERAFVRISVDGELVFEGRIAPMEVQQYEADEQIQILTGNAAALRVTYNGRDLGLLGNVGEVVNRVFTISGVVTPTITASPTPTNTLPVTSTPTPSLTPTPTPEEETSG
jgi:cytoskeletal protein RodZ